MATPNEQQLKFYSFLEELAGKDNSLLKRLASMHKETGVSVAEMDDAQLEETKRNFVASVLLPRVNNKLANTKGKDYKYYADLYHRAEPYSTIKFNRDFDALVNFYGAQNLGQLSRDDDWVAGKAESQRTSPDVIRKEISDAFAAHQKKVARDAQEKADKETAEARQKLWDEGSLSMKAAKFAGRIVAPEFTNWAEESIKSGTEKEGLGKALIKDVAFNAGSLLLSGGASKLAGAATRGAGTVAKVAGNAAASGTSSAITEGAREVTSDYEELDPLQIGSTFVAGAGVSGVAKGVSSKARNVKGGKSVSKGVREEVYGGAESSAEQLQQAWKQTVKNFKHNATQMERQGTKEMIEQRAKELNVQPATIKKYIKSGKTPEIYSGKVSAKTVKKHPELFQQEIQEMKTAKSPAEIRAGQAKIGLLRVTEGVLGPREPLNAVDKKTPIKKQAEEMGVDETTIRMWDSNFRPNDEEGRNLYEQWKKRYKK